MSDATRMCGRRRFAEVARGCRGGGHDVVMSEPTPLRAPRIRRAPVPDDAVLVVRGDDLDPATSRVQAELFRRRFPDWGRYGLSAYYARNRTEIDDLAADQLERFPAVAIF